VANRPCLIGSKTSLSPSRGKLKAGPYGPGFLLFPVNTGTYKATISIDKSTHVGLLTLREKVRMCVYNTSAGHGDEWPGYEGMCPQVNLTFSLEEVPTFGRDSSREKAR
jgi:hypothetical protein